MTQPFAKIRIHTHLLPQHKCFYTFEWIGKPWWPVAIANHYDIGVEIDHKNNKITGLPWRLLVIDMDAQRDLLICRRADIPWLFSALFDWLRLWAFNGWRSFAARFVLTLQIWGLHK